MKNVLIIGSTGQIGSELTMKLRSIYNGNIVAGYIPGAEPKGELKESGPSAIVDITNEQQIAETVSKYNIDTIYNLTIGCSRSQTSTSMENRHGRPVQRIGSSTRNGLRRIYPKFYRCLRQQHP